MKPTLSEILLQFLINKTHNALKYIFVTTKNVVFCLTATVTEFLFSLSTTWLVVLEFSFMFLYCLSRPISLSCPPSQGHVSP